VNNVISPVHECFGELAMVFTPTIYVLLGQGNLRDYGLKFSQKLLPQGISLALGIGLCLSLVTSPQRPFLLEWEWIVIGCLIAPICEEFFFRGFIQTILMNKINGGKRIWKAQLSYGLIISAFIFGAFHLTHYFMWDCSPLEAGGDAGFAVLAGLLLGYLYQQTGSILIPSLMHSCLNGSSLLPW
jgi:membrane protease YdiL (CAAX protease family)